jgi:hypothetical protein
MTSTPEKFDDSCSEISDNYNPRQRLWSRAHLMQDVDPKLSTLPLAAYCFMSGWLFVFHFYSFLHLLTILIS